MRVREAIRTGNLIGRRDGSDLGSPAAWLTSGRLVWKPQLILSPFGVEGKNHYIVSVEDRICFEPKFIA